MARPSAANHGSLVAWLTGLLVALPIAVDLCLRGTRAAVTYLAHDSFYYLSVARNVARAGTFSFDGTHPTNGFHPLWQWTVSALESLRLLLGWSEVSQLYVLVVVSALVVSAAIVWTGLILHKQGGLSPLFTLVPLGLIGAIASLANNRFGTLYTFVNGMETPFVLLGYSMTLAMGSRLSALSTSSKASQLRVGLLWGLALSFLMLSRLDHALFVASLLGLFLLRARLSTTPNYGPILVAGGTVTVCALGYAGFNLLACGSLVPVSGSEKSSFPVPHFSNIRALLTQFDQDTMGRTWQMFLPIPLALLDLLLRSRRYLRDKQISPWETTLFAWSLFTLILCSYNILYVSLWHQGTWYFASLFLHNSVLLCQYSRDLLPRRQTQWAWAGAGAMVSVLWFALLFHRTDPNELIFRFIAREREPLVEHYRKSPPRIYSVDDGLLTYLTPFSTLSGIGLTLDAEAAKQKRQGGSLLDLAYKRGYDRFCSWYYGRSLVGLTRSSSQADIRERLDKIPWFWDEFRAHGEKFDFSIEYISPSRELYVLRFQPHQQEPAVEDLEAKHLISKSEEHDAAP